MEGRLPCCSFKFRALVCLVVLLCNGKLNSQNLILNNSFEFGACPTSIGQIHYAWGWVDARGNTTDYFNPCGIGFMQPPSNLFGTQAAADGVCYAGFRAWTNGAPDYFEFPACTLTTPLDPCQFYKISYKVSRAAGDQGGWWAVDQLGFVFFDYVGNTSQFTQEIWDPAFEPDYATPDGSYITDSTGWTTISATYLAEGGEIYLVLGNFELLNTVPIWAGGLSSFSAYYFLDDVYVEPLNATLLGQDRFLCTGDTLLLQTGVCDSILWSDGSSSPDFSITGPGTYWVTVTNGRCTYSDTIVVTASAYPDFSLPNDTVLCEGELLQIGANVPGTYSWNSGSTNQMVNADTNGIYILSVTANGCTTTDEVDIRFEDCVFIPNAFSPNNDGQNDMLFVRGYKSGYFHFAVFDRWGTKVFESYDPAIGWEGMVNNQPGMEAVYVYYAELDSHEYGGRYIKKGNVSLIR